MAREGLYDAAHEVPWEEHLDPEATFAVEATLRDSEHTHSGFVALKIKDALVDRLREQPRRTARRRHPAARRAHRGPPRGHQALALARRRRRAAEPARLPRPAHGGTAQGDAGRRHPPRRRATPATSPSSTRCAARAPSSSRRASSPSTAPRTFTGPSASSAGPRSAPRRSRRSTGSAPRRAPTSARRPSPSSGSIGPPRRSRPRAPTSGPPGSSGRSPSPRRTPRAHSPSASWPTACWSPIPPYGDRLTVGGQKGMKTFYFHLGERLGALPGFRLAILSGNPAFEAAFHHRPLRRRALWNGPIECTCSSTRPAGRAQSPAPGGRRWTRLRRGDRAQPPVPQTRGSPAPEQPPDVPLVRPEHRGEEHRGQRGGGRRRPGHEPGHRHGDDPGEQ